MDIVGMQTCRMCFSTHNGQIDIFNHLVSVNVAEIITEHIGEVSVSDALPKTVCIHCWRITETFHKFHRTVKSAQANYLDGLVKCESTVAFDVSESFVDEFFDVKPPNFVEVIQNDNNFVEEIVSNEKYTNLDDTGQRAHKIRSRKMTIETKPLQADIEEDLFTENKDGEDNSLMNDANFSKRNNDSSSGSNSSDDMNTFNEKPNKKKKLVAYVERTRKSPSKQCSNYKYMYEFICDFCGKIFPRKYLIYRHLLAHVTSFACKLCPKRCTTKKLLDQHDKVHHNLIGTADDVQKQDDVLKEIRANVKKISESKLEETMSKHFDMTCDVCGDVLKSLQQAQFHYMHEHQIPNGYIKCCGIKFDKKYNINGHIFWHINPEMFKCGICGKMQKMIYTFYKHLSEHKNKIGPNPKKCIECNIAFSRKEHLHRHMETAHGVTANKRAYRQLPKSANDSNATLSTLNVNDYFDMTCDICAALLDSLQHAKLHYFDEHGIANGYIKCCDKKFKEVNEVSDHLKYHLDPEIFKCHICDKTFATKHRLIIHRSHHKAMQRYACTMCNKAFKSKSCLDIHVKRHDPRKPEKVIPCELCDKRFSNEYLRKSHADRMHSKSEKVKSEICEFCAKTFFSRSEVDAHIRKVHSTTSQPSERVQCKICDAWLGTRYVLKQHMLRHTAEPQKCPQCDKVSPNRDALASHIREVHSERTHKCHLCDKSFNAAYVLKSHIAIHTGEKPFKCTLCPESFIWKTEVYKHRKRAHPDEYDQMRERKRRKL